LTAWQQCSVSIQIGFLLLCADVKPRTLVRQNRMFGTSGRVPFYGFPERQSRLRGTKSLLFL